MSPKKASPDKPQPAALIRAVDSYKETVWSLLALIHELTWDSKLKRPRTDVEHLHGALHHRAGGDPVTPDVSLVVGTEYVVLGDVKMSFASDEKSRAKIAAQLMKYDEAAAELARVKALTTSEIGTLLLTHLTRKIDAADYLEACETFMPAHPFAIIAYVRTDQSKVFFSLERSYGKLVPSAKDDAFRHVIAIGMEHVLLRFGAVSFYDANPPMAHVLAMLWDRVISQLITESSFAHAEELASEDADRTESGARETTPLTEEFAAHPGVAGQDEEAAENEAAPADEVKSSRRTITVRISAEKVGAILRDRFSLRAVDKKLPGAPKQAAVLNAITLLVKWGLAADVGDGQYDVSYRKLRPNTLDFFCKKLGAKPKKGPSGAAEPSSTQLKLF